MGREQTRDKFDGKITERVDENTECVWCVGTWPLGRGVPTVNLRLNESRRNQQSTSVENKVRQSFLVPKEFVRVNDLATLNPDRVVFNNFAVSKNFAVDDLGDFGLVLREWSEGHGGRGRRGEVVVGLKGNRVLHHGGRGFCVRLIVESLGVLRC